MKIYLVVAAIMVVCCQPSTSYVARHDLISSEYQTEFNKWVGRGYRLKQVSGYYSATKKRALYAAIWVKTDGRQWIAKHGMKSSQYQSKFNKYVRKGYRLTHVSGYAVGKTAYYAAIWEKIGGPRWFASHGLTSAQYQTEFNKHANRYILKCLSAYTVNGRDYYATIWQKNDGRRWVGKHRMTSSYYQSQFNHWKQRGYRLVIVSGYQLNGKARYAAVWEKRNGPSLYARHGMSSRNYQAAFDNRHYRGYKLKYVVGFLVSDKIQYAAIWHSRNIWKNKDLRHIDKTVHTFLKDNKIPGGSLAITKNGKLVFAQGYGKADINKNYDASPKHLWRIASISKPITAVSIMRLKELGKLKLSDKVFGPGSILGNTYAGGVYSAREKKITVKHLLEHTAGGTTWNNKNGDGSSDPMFIFKEKSHEELIKYILQTREPSAEPGTLFSYSNFGYCILGRIIEKLTGQSYQHWVKTKVLKKMGAKRIYIGGNTKAQRKKPYEVIYYRSTSSSSSPYNMNVRRMDSHGGWITNPIDLLRFMVHVDGFSTVPDELQQSSITTMTKPSALNAGYSKGWSVNPSNNWWHGGSLPGSMSILVRTANGYTWSFMCNKRGSGNIDSLMWSIINGVSSWPNANYDFF